MHICIVLRFDLHCRSMRYIKIDVILLILVVPANCYHYTGNQLIVIIPQLFLGGLRLCCCKLYNRGMWQDSMSYVPSFIIRSFEVADI